MRFIQMLRDLQAERDIKFPAQIPSLCEVLTKKVFFRK
ncbi:hypothetical protein OPIT5_28460 [Opitutaceae bacterium TAV5]|nr:hypothetical protein OPIT5_28460 [Opitutaceae bacterium TAV5]